MANMTMAELMAAQDQTKTQTRTNIYRGAEVEGTIISFLEKEIVIDLGTKAEGILLKRDLTPEQLEKAKPGDKITAFVTNIEAEGGQIYLGFNMPVIKQPVDSRRPVNNRNTTSPAKIKRFEDLKKSGEVIVGKGTELNKGGLVVEIDETKAFLPTSQMSLESAANLEALVGKDMQVFVIEVDASQNRFIVSQKLQVNDETKKKLKNFKKDDSVTGKVVAVLPFGVFVSLDDGVEGLVHVSEVSWEKVEDPSTVVKVGDSVEAKVISLDENNGRVNLSIKQLAADPFAKIAEDYAVDDVVKATVSKVTSQGISFTLKDGVEGFMPSAKQDPETTYEVGAAMNVLVDNIDSAKRRINLVPFITSTKDLIYK